MNLKIFISFILFSVTVFQARSQDHETCSFSEDAWSSDTAAITAFLISCGRIDTTNYDEHGKVTKDKPHHQQVIVKLNSGKILHNDTVYFIAEEMPAFPGGLDSLMQYLKSNIQYPEKAVATNTQGKVFVSFIIDRNGIPAKIKVLRSLGNGCDEESVRVIKTMPKWKPGKIKGKPVRVQLNLPITFSLR